MSDKDKRRMLAKFVWMTLKLNRTFCSDLANAQGHVELCIWSACFTGLRLK